MSYIRKILVPVDDSACSLVALTHASALAEDLGAVIDVLHVVDGPGSELGSEVTTAIGRMQNTLGDRVSRRSETGEPLRTILEIAASENFDLIVMGTHGRVGRLRSRAGSLAAAVVRNAPCPVFTVREPGGESETFREQIHGAKSLADQVRS